MTRQEAIVRGKSLEYWKGNAEENYPATPISVLKYISILEEHIDNSESKTTIDFNKLRDEFFDECVDKRAFCEIGESFDRVVSLAPDDMFEWIKKKING